VDFQAEVICAGIFFGDKGGGNPHAEAYLNDKRAVIAEKGLNIEGPLFKGKTIGGGQGFPGTPLGLAHPARPEDVTFYPPGQKRARARGAGGNEGFFIHKI
jgi:hypothetical protein